MATTKDDLERRVGELEDELKRRDERIAELRDEVDEMRDLVSRLRENAEDHENIMEAWRDTFDMKIVEARDGRETWTWEPFWDEHYELVDNYNKLVDRWNRFLPLINGKDRPIGRPLAASEAQVDKVRRLHKDGMSLRDIMIETNLGFSTVRTIVGQINRNDRTTKKHRARFERIERDKAQAARWKRIKRTGDALPKRAQAVVEQSRALAMEARGLGRSR
jgi:hypothetical protein